MEFYYLQMSLRFYSLMLGFLVAGIAVYVGSLAWSIIRKKKK